MNKQLVVLSGGQDSVTCLGMALSGARGTESVHAITFNYGQRHACELEAAKRLCQKYSVTQIVIDLPFVGRLVRSALTAPGDINRAHPDNDKLPASFVPGRNALFLTLAHAHAQQIGAGSIITGVCQTDYSGYPDCREVFIEQLEMALNVGYCSNIRIVAPLMHLTKCDTFALADSHGFLVEVLRHSHTCYNGDHTTFHEWGFGCGTCPACELRRKGWREFAEKFPQRAEIASTEAMRRHVAGIL